MHRRIWQQKLDKVQWTSNILQSWHLAGLTLTNVKSRSPKVRSSLFVIQHLAIQAVVISFLFPEASYFVAIP